MDDSVVRAQVQRAEVRSHGSGKKQKEIDELKSNLKYFSQEKRGNSAVGSGGCPSDPISRKS